MMHAKILSVLLLASFLVAWMRADAHSSWPLPQVLPFLGGHSVSGYDLAGLIMAGMFIARLARLASAGSRSETSRDNEGDYEITDDSNGDAGDDDADAGDQKEDEN